MLNEKKKIEKIKYLKKNNKLNNGRLSKIKGYIFKYKKIQI